MDNEHERNEHFKGFARLTLQKLMNKYDHLPPGEWGPAESDEIILAQCAYDLVYHALYCNGVDARYWPGKPQQASDYYKRQIAKATNDVPDLTEWPKTASE